MTQALQDRVDKLEERVSELEEALQAGSIRSAKGGLASFLLEIEPSTHIQRSVTIGYYLLHKEGQNSFTINDIEEGYNECRIAKPANFSDVLAGAEEKDWAMRHKLEGRRQLWKITSDGDSAVEGGFD